jgi:hypothetical protein
MRKNEPTAAKRVAGPIPFYDANGALKKNLTFDNGSNEVYTYRASTNDWVAANADTTELGGANTTGMYLLQLSQAETNYDTVVGVKLVKAGYDDQFWFERIDNTPDVNVSTIAADAVNADAIKADAVTEIQGSIPGLQMRRSMTDQCVYSAKKVLTSARTRVFASEVALAAAGAGNANGADGEVERWRWTAVDPGTGLATSWKLVQEL